MMGRDQLFRLELKADWHGECEKKLQKHKLFARGLAVMFTKERQGRAVGGDFLGGMGGS